VPLVVRQLLGCLASSGVRSALLVAIVISLAGCGDGQGPTPPTVPPPANAGCGLGPVPIATTGPEPCAIAAGCPMARPSPARTLVWVATWSFRGRDGGCEAIQLPGCPTSTKLVSVTLASLNAGASACPIAGELQVDAQATTDGGVHLRWRAEELDPATCRASGDRQEAEATLTGPCCSRTVDVYLPRQDLTARLQVRSDWRR